MAITKEEITKALHLGVRATSKNYVEWSKGLSLADSPEYLVVVEIARNINKKLGGSESLRLEMQYAQVLAGAGFVQGRGAPLKAINGGKKADLVLLKDWDKPTCVIEVKKNPSYDGVQKDLKRLRDVVYACRHHKGLLKHGFLSICLSDAPDVNYKVDSVVDSVGKFFRNERKARAKPPNVRTWNQHAGLRAAGGAGESASVVVEITPR